MTKPYEALLANSGESDGPAPLRAAHEQFLQWRNLSLSKWRDLWRKSRFDEICSALPRILEDFRILPETFLSYSYVPNQRHGRWADAHGSTVSLLPPQSRFAVLLTQTPVPHYTLLERVNLVVSVRIACCV